jgi:Swt1-like HEPN
MAMTNKALRTALLRKLGVTKQRLSQRVQALIRKVPMGTEEAVYCIAHQEGLRLDRFVDGETVARVRGLVSTLNSRNEFQEERKVRTKIVTKVGEVRIGGVLSITDPILPSRMIAEAKEMSEKVYPIMYVFENSVREVLRRVLGQAIGPDWWDRCASENVRRTVRERMRQETEIPWHGARGAHPIFYTDIKDLVSIVRNQNAWQALKAILGNIEWFSQLINCIGASRNPLAHMNPISRHDRQRVILNFRDWERVVKAKHALIPTS